MLIAWFGPRGLSTLLLVLLPVFRDGADALALFQVACLVVLLSIAVHGGALFWMGRSAVSPAGASPALASAPADPPELMRPAELGLLYDFGERVIPIDTRSEADWRRRDAQARGARRFSPERSAAEQARVMGLPQDAWLVLFCT
jgi:hypothetical protein